MERRELIEEAKEREAALETEVRRWLRELDLPELELTDSQRLNVKMTYLTLEDTDVREEPDTVQQAGYSLRQILRSLGQDEEAGRIFEDFIEPYEDACEEAEVRWWAKQHRPNYVEDFEELDYRWDEDDSDWVGLMR
jgi:hypothetical protein